MQAIQYLDQTLNFRSSLNFRDTIQHLLEEIQSDCQIKQKKIQLKTEKYDKNIENTSRKRS